MKFHRPGTIGKDEVSSSNLLSSSKIFPRNCKVSGDFFFITVSGVRQKDIQKDIRPQNIEYFTV